jgi:aldehyde dehydrogenase (NAD+)
MGKILIETRGDVQEGVDMAYLAAGEGRRLYGVTTPSEMPNKWAMSVRVPIGVVRRDHRVELPVRRARPGRSSPRCSPGNTVVFKPSEETPEMGWQLAKLFEEIGLPAGVFNVVHGTAPGVGWPMVQHPGIDVLSFTGLERGRGQDRHRRRAARQARLARDGWQERVIVMDRRRHLARGQCAWPWGAFGTTGQRCTATSRVIVHERVHDELVKLVVPAGAGAQAGRRPRWTGVEMGPLVNARQLERVSGYMKVGGRRGREGGQRRRSRQRAGLDARLLLPAHRAHRTCSRTCASPQEEIFGPVVGFVKVKSLEEAIAINNATPFGLSSFHLHARTCNAAFTAMRDLTTGIVYVNHGTTGAETTPAVRRARAARATAPRGGHTMLDAFTEWKSVYVDFSGKVQARADRQQLASLVPSTARGERHPSERCHELPKSRALRADPRCPCWTGQVAGHYAEEERATSPPRYGGKVLIKELSRCRRGGRRQGPVAWTARALRPLTRRSRRRADILALTIKGFRCARCWSPRRPDIAKEYYCANRDGPRQEGYLL